MDDEQVIEFLSDLQLVSRQSIGKLLKLAKEASLEGRTKDCLRLGKQAMNCLVTNNETAKTILLYNHLYEWAAIEEAEGSVTQDQLCEVLAGMCEVSMGVKTMQNYKVEA